MIEENPIFAVEISISPTFAYKFPPTYKSPPVVVIPPEDARVEIPLMFKFVPVILPPERFVAIVAVAALPEISTA